MATKQRIPSQAESIVGGVNAFDDLAGAIAVPDPTRPLRNAIGAAGRRYCEAIGATPGLYGDILRNTQGVPSLLCKPYWDNNRWTPPQEEKPFSGGQCAATYRPEGTYVNTNAAAGPTGVRNWRLNVAVVGPLRGWVSAGSPVGTQWGFLSASNSGLPFGSAVDTGNNKQVFGPNTVGGSSQMLSAAPPTITNTGIQSGTDNCGDAAPVLEPGANPPPSPGPFPTGQEPGVDPDGQPFFFVPPIPNPFGGGDPIDPPSIEPPPTGPGGGGDGGPPGGTEGPGGTAEPGDDAEGEADEGEELVALKIDIVQFAENAREIAPGLYRGVCYVFMGNSEGLDLDPAGAILGDGQLVLAERDRLTRWRVSANIGYILNVTPYYRTTEP